MAQLPAPPLLPDFPAFSSSFTLKTPCKGKDLAVVGLSCWVEAAWPFRLQLCHKVLGFF